MQNIKAKPMDHPTFLMKILEGLKGVECIAGISLGAAVGWINFLDNYLLADPNFIIAAARSFFVAILTGVGAVIGTASGKWLINICKTKLFKKKK